MLHGLKVVSCPAPFENGKTGILHFFHVLRGVMSPAGNPPAFHLSAGQPAVVPVVCPASVLHREKDDPVKEVGFNWKPGFTGDSQFQACNVVSLDEEAVHHAVQDDMTASLGQSLGNQQYLTRIAVDGLVYLDVSELCVTVPGIPETGDQHPLEEGVHSCGVRVKGLFTLRFQPERKEWGKDRGQEPPPATVGNGLR